MTKVNSWTEWGPLKTIVVGRADNACFLPEEPAFRGKIYNKEIEKELDWPLGKRKQSIIDKANLQLDNLSDVLKDLGITVLRPDPIDFNKTIMSPDWTVPNMFCCTCPRDVMITIGQYVLEATLSRRGRFFEYLPYRDIMYNLWDEDPTMKWKAAPKPSMNDAMYWEGFWDKFKGFDLKSPAEQEAFLREYKFALNESEIAFDAADITRCGRDIFMHHSVTANLKAAQWLKRELEGYVRVHILHFPHDKTPVHIDCTFVPLRPPRGDKPGLVLTNPDRPLEPEEAQLFKDNNWEFVDAPEPNQINDKMPAFALSSKWLSMNLLSINEQTVVVEENEVELHSLLKDLGFDIIKVPFRDVFEFGGSLHCATWDIEREDSAEDFFKTLSS